MIYLIITMQSVTITADRIPYETISYGFKGDTNDRITRVFPYNPKQSKIALSLYSS